MTHRVSLPLARLRPTAQIINSVAGRLPLSAQRPAHAETLVSQGPSAKPPPRPPEEVRSSEAGRPARTFKSYDEMDPTLVDQMALINATPLGVDEVTVPVGIEGLRQDWFRVGELLRNAMGAVSEEEAPEVSEADQRKR